MSTLEPPPRASRALRALRALSSLVTACSPSLLAPRSIFAYRLYRCTWCPHPRSLLAPKLTCLYWTPLSSKPPQLDPPRNHRASLRCRTKFFSPLIMDCTFMSDLTSQTALSIFIASACPPRPLTRRSSRPVRNRNETTADALSPLRSVPLQRTRSVSHLPLCLSSSSVAKNG